LSIDGAGSLLDGWEVCVSHRACAPVRVAAKLLGQFGATPRVASAGDGCTLAIRTAAGRAADVTLAGWRGEPALVRAQPNGAPLTAFAALRLAAAAARGSHARISGRILAAELCGPAELAGGTRPELLRCGDGWIVTRWRDDGERALFAAIAGELHRRSAAEVVAEARVARLLVAAVEPPRGQAAAEFGSGALGAAAGRARRRPRVIDWSVLWAGPWAAEQMRRSGSLVERVEHPRRRDGLLGWPQGRRLWSELNGDKRTSLLDAHRAHDRGRLEQLIAAADVLITSMTPRALRSLGFTDDWRAERAPHLLHLELVAFDDPWSDAPGLGEHASAQAGLLWRDGREPAPPLPWADSLLGAAALAAAQAWLASAERPAGRVRLSLERAARLAFAVNQSGIE
jgi:hypothetical protein